MGSNLTNFGSNRLEIDRQLSARQIRAARALLGWSRRELATLSGVSEGTIKAIEQGAVDTRLTTMHKLAQTFAACSIEFVAEDPWTGVVVKNTEADRKPHKRRVPRTYRPSGGESQSEPDASGNSDGATHQDHEEEATPRRLGLGWFRSLRAGRR